MARVEDYMQQKFSRIPDTTPLREAFRKMGEEQVSFFVVLRGGYQVAGIITRGDFIRLRGDILLKEGIVRDVIGEQTLVAVTFQDFMQDACRKFELSPDIDQVVVLDLLNPVGVLTKEDIIRWMYKQEFPPLLTD